jgi:hypothetical protein
VYTHLEEKNEIGVNPGKEITAQVKIELCIQDSLLRKESSTIDRATPPLEIDDL